MATATFGGTYTANGGQDYASGTVDLTPYGGSTTTVELDSSGSYSTSVALVLTSSTGLWLNDAGEVVDSPPNSGSQLIVPGGTVPRGWVKVTENLDGVPPRSFVVRTSPDQAFDTGRDVGTVLAGSASASGESSLLLE